MLRQVLVEIDGAPSKRPSYIGDMYEGLAHKLLAVPFPDDLELNLVEGVLVRDNGIHSDQKDLILIRGKAGRLPYAEHYLVPIWEAIAVFEVKKRFTLELMNEYFAKTAGMSQLFREYPLREISSDDAIARCRGYRPRFEPEPIGYCASEGVLRSNLEEDISLPLRIGIGFQGPAKWSTFRRQCEKTISETIIAAHLHQLPTLVVSGNHALVKTNGSPYFVPTKEDLYIPYATTHGNPWLFIAKIIWERLIETEGYRWTVYSDDDDPESLLPLCALSMPEFSYVPVVAICQNYTFGWLPRYPVNPYQ